MQNGCLQDNICRPRFFKPQHKAIVLSRHSFSLTLHWFTLYYSMTELSPTFGHSRVNTNSERAREIVSPRERQREQQKGADNYEIFSKYLEMRTRMNWVVHRNLCRFKRFSNSMPSTEWNWATIESTKRFFVLALSLVPLLRRFAVRRHESKQTTVYWQLEVDSADFKVFFRFLSFCFWNGHFVKCTLSWIIVGMSQPAKIPRRVISSSSR